MNNYNLVFERLAAYGMGLLIFFILLILAVITVYILFLVAMNNAIRVVSPQNRKIQPGIPFLLLAPSLLNMVLAFTGIPYITTIVSLAAVGLLFYIVKGIADSLQAEYLMRGMAVDGKPTYNIGITYVLISAVSVLLSFIPSLSAMAAISLILGLGALVVWIIYWVQLAQNKNILKNTPAFQAGTSQIF